MTFDEKVQALRERGLSDARIESYIRSKIAQQGLTDERATQYLQDHNFPVGDPSPQQSRLSEGGDPVAPFEATWGDVGQQLGQGASLGFSDEAQAKMLSLQDGRPYEEHLAEIRQRMGQYAEENPIKSFLLQTIGSAATLPVTGPLRLPAAAATKGIPILRNLLGGTKAAPAISRAVLGGAGTGAAAGAGYTEEGDRLTGAVGGGLLGAGAGGALSTGGHILRGLGRGIRNRFDLNPEGQAQDVLRGLIDDVNRGPNPLSEQDILRKLAADPDAMLPDVHDAFVNPAAGLASQPGTSGPLAREALDARRAGQGPRIDKALEDALGDTSITIDPKKIDWTAVKGQSIDLDETGAKELLGFMDMDYFKPAWNEARKLAQTRNEKLPSLAKFKRDLKAGKIDSLSVQTVQDIKKVFDDIIEPKRDPITGIASPKYGKNKTEAYKGIRAKFREFATSRSDDYAEALAETAKQKAPEAAFDDGLKFNLSKGNLELGKQKMASLKTPEQKRKFQEGVIQQLMDGLRGKVEAGETVVSMTQKKLHQLDAIIGKEKTDQLRALLKKEKDFDRVGGRVVAGSQTADKLAAQEQVNADTLAQAGGAAQMALQLLTNWKTALVGGLSRPAKKETRARNLLGKAFFTPGQGGAAELQRLLSAQQGGIPQILGDLTRQAARREAGRTGRFATE